MSAPKMPEIHWMDANENLCVVLQVVEIENDGQRIIVKYGEECQLEEHGP